MIDGLYCWTGRREASLRSLRWPMDGLAILQGPSAAASDRRLRISIMGVTMHDQSPVPELSIMRLPEVAAVCGKSRAAIYKAIRKGEFPKQVKLSARASGWVRCEIEAWVKARMAAR